MNVMLFDIDGTLILTDRAGQQAMEEVIAESGNARTGGRINFAGRTDRSIVADHLRSYGLEDTEQNFLRYSSDFLERLPASLAARNGFVLPGVIDTLQRLRDDPNIHLGLLTGNLRRAAHIKLAHFGLDKFFYHDGEAFGGFGDRQHHRDDVAREALADVHERIDARVEPKSVCVIGDTPRDVQCAKAIGANVLAVATGGYSLDELADAEPDFIANDLENADQWWQAIALSSD